MRWGNRLDEWMRAEEFDQKPGWIAFEREKDIYYNILSVVGKERTEVVSWFTKRQNRVAESGDERHSNSVSTGCKKGPGPGPPPTLEYQSLTAYSPRPRGGHAPLFLCCNSQNRLHRLRPTGS